ncbi:MAG: CopG family transcriptional regulator [Actinobacteria bacterium]|nr:CopG family transcriptional regulator [Actinomycetota bacterium]
MTSKKINFTIPEENLKEIEEFCKDEKVSKSWLIREAASRYICAVKEKRELDRKIKDMVWAQETSKKLREKSKGFRNNKRGFEVIRESRDRKQ